MKDVMRDCDGWQKFDAYVYCIKSTYNKTGNNPNNLAVRAFYSNLEMIGEAYKENKITDAQAKSYAYDSFMRTVQASNDRADAAFMNIQQLQLMQQQTNQQRAPIQTNCVRNGAYTNCTSY